jgi:hypothetical protein
MLTSSGWAMGIEPAESEQAAVMSEQKETETIEPKVEAEKTSEVAGATEKKETETIESKRTPTTQNAQLLEEYVPEVIIEAEWQKIKEKLGPIEGDPWGGWISCATEIYGEFTTGTVSFGFWHQNVEPYPPVMPRSITIDEEENLYILDPANFRVLKFDKEGEYLDTINLERVKPTKGQLGRFEIAEGCDIGFEESKIHVNEDKIYIKKLKFLKTGKIVGTGSPSFEGKNYRQLSPSKVAKDDRTVYEIVFSGRKEEGKDL